MMRAHEVYWIVLTLLGLACVACGKTLDDSTPQHPSDAGFDGGKPAPDAAPSEPEDASGGADGSDATSTPTEAGGTDATSGSDEAGEADAAADVSADAARRGRFCGRILCRSIAETTTCTAAIAIPTIYGGLGGANPNSNITIDGANPTGTLLTCSP